MRDSVYLHLKKACTKRLDPPGQVRSADIGVDDLDADLLQHCCSSVIFYCPDGASDEQRAGRLLHGRTNQHHWLHGVFSNMKGVLRGPAHASTRIVNTPMESDRSLVGSI